MKYPEYENHEGGIYVVKYRFSVQAAEQNEGSGYQNREYYARFPGNKTNITFGLDILIYQCNNKI